MGRISSFSVWVGGVLILLFQGSPLQAAVTCGKTISEEVTLTENVTCDTATALIVEGPGGQLNLGGHTVSCVGIENTIGILLVGEKATLTHGTVANCQLGVVAADKGQHRIKEIISRDHASAGFSTRGLGISLGSHQNFFISNYAENVTDGFNINGNENFLFNNTTVDSGRGFVVSQKKNTFTLNVAANNDIGFFIHLGAEENHVIKNLADGNAFAGFEVEGNRNKLVKNRAIGNGRSMIDVGFRIIDANENFLAWNLSEKNIGIGFEIVGLFSRSERNVLRGNVAQNNEQVGIALQLFAENNTVIENTGKENEIFDLQDANPDCGGNHWSQNTFNTADPESCIH
ncbi:MAG: right-handed parallel beta-helix repeat-containing protein [Nitrospirota bacterium]|nr:MAG: right-handed parallel beta-helix repeat-containing protein [Nitrospirota bacterium]